MGTGLDSQILGDFEIIAQMRQSFKLSKELKVINPFFDRLFSSVMQASKRIKNETKLSSGATSVSFAAVRYILDNYIRLNRGIYGYLHDPDVDRIIKMIRNLQN